MTSWAKYHIEKLLKGETVSFRPSGSSMTPRIQSRQLCTVEPIFDHSLIEKNDVVLCRVSGNDYFHLVKAIQNKGESFLIANNHGHDNGWTNSTKVFGKLIKIEN